MESYFWIAIGSAFGGAARFWLSGAVAILIGEEFPFGTLIINILGSFVIGFFGTITGPDGRFLAGAVTRQFVMIGICGGFTTFSSFSLQTLNLMNEGEWFFAGLNAGLSVALCLFCGMDWALIGDNLESRKLGPSHCVPLIVFMLFERSVFSGPVEQRDGTSSRRNSPACVHWRCGQEGWAEPLPDHH